MLKAVTRQATSVDAKIRALNNAPSSNTEADDVSSEDHYNAHSQQVQHRQNPISTANFFDHYATTDDIAVMVTEQDFLDAHRELIPSVSAGELEHYETVRATFEGVKDKKKEAAITSEQGQVNGHAKSNHQQQDLAVRSSSRSKGKDVKGKGKGKAIATESDDDDDEQPQYNDDKGKGKAVAEFQDGTASDDEGLY